MKELPLMDQRSARKVLANLKKRGFTMTTPVGQGFFQGMVKITLKERMGVSYAVVEGLQHKEYRSYEETHLDSYTTRD